jgi:hypothetical protein
MSCKTPSRFGHRFDASSKPGAESGIIFPVYPLGVSKGLKVGILALCLISRTLTIGFGGICKTRYLTK